MGTITKFTVDAVTKSADVEDQYDFIGSTEDADRDGDVIRIDGWDTADFEKNPVIFYGHDYRGVSVKFPIGTGTVSKDIANRRLMFSVNFTDATEDAQTVKALVDAGVLRACSVGFIPKQGAVNLIVNPDSGEVMGREFNGQTLLELSIVPLPANPNAMRLALSKGLCTEEKAKEWGLLADAQEFPLSEKKYFVTPKNLEDRVTALELLMKSKIVEPIEQKNEAIAEAGGESSTVSTQESAFYAELLTVGRSLADFLHPTESEADKSAKELAEMLKQMS